MSGGFRFKRINFVGGSADFPVGISDRQERLLKSENIVKAVAQALIDMNIGWVLDVDKNPTITSFVSIPQQNGDETSPGLFLKNISVSNGCKLFIAYFTGPSSYGCKNFSGHDITWCYNYPCSNYGLVMSIIPEGSSSEFGDPNTTTFLPSDATRIVGTCFITNNNTSDYTYTRSFSYARNGYTYSWGIFATTNAIAVSCTYSSSNTIERLYSPAYCVGKVIGELGNKEDNTLQSKYGCLRFRWTTGDSGNTGYAGLYEGYTPLSATNVDFYDGYGSIKIHGHSMFPGSYSISDVGYFAGSFSRADGTWLNTSQSENCNPILNYENGLGLLSKNVYNQGNNTCAWIPFTLYIITSYPETYNIVPGNCFKGWIDSDLFRVGRGEYGETYENGNFICLGNSLIVGWSPLNDSLI